MVHLLIEVDREIQWYGRDFFLQSVPNITNPIPVLYVIFLWSDPSFDSRTEIWILLHLNRFGKVDKPIKRHFIFQYINLLTTGRKETIISY